MVHLEQSCAARAYERDTMVCVRPARGQQVCLIPAELACHGSSAVQVSFTHQYIYIAVMTRAWNGVNKFRQLESLEQQDVNSGGTPGCEQWPELSLDLLVTRQQRRVIVSQ